MRNKCYESGGGEKFSGDKHWSGPRKGINLTTYSLRTINWV